MTDPYSRVPGPICRECGRPSLATIRGLCPDCRRLTRAEERRLVDREKRKARKRAVSGTRGLPQNSPQEARNAARKRLTAN